LPKEALLLAGKLNYPKGKAEASKNLAVLNILTSNGKEAMKYVNQGIIYSTAIHDPYLQAKLYSLKASLLQDQSNIPRLFPFIINHTCYSTS